MLPHALHAHLLVVLNPIERGSDLLTRQAVQRDSFRSVADLKQQVETFVDHRNKHLAPFM